MRKEIIRLETDPSFSRHLQLPLLIGWPVPGWGEGEDFRLSRGGPTQIRYAEIKMKRNHIIKLRFVVVKKLV
jgi:hypothetical protein